MDQASIIRKNKAAIIRLLGRGPLERSTINAFGRIFLGPGWGGAWASDEVPTTLAQNDGRHFYIVNTGSTRGPGVHWLAVYWSGRHVYIYDSFGRPIARLSPTMVGRLRRSDRFLTRVNITPEQRGDSTVCGQISLAWLLGVKEYGIAAMTEQAVEF